MDSAGEELTLMLCCGSVEMREEEEHPTKKSMVMKSSPLYFKPLLFTKEGACIMAMHLVLITNEVLL